VCEWEVFICNPRKNYQIDYSLTWSESEAVCVAEGGHLVSIYDEVEQDFIIQLVHRYNFRNVWIGLNELRTVNTYEWTDGEPVSHNFYVK